MLFCYLFWNIKMSIQASTLTLKMAAVLAQLLSMAIFLGTPRRSEVDGTPDKAPGSPLLVTWLRLRGWTARQSDTVDY